MSNKVAELKKKVAYEKKRVVVYKTVALSFILENVSKNVTSGLCWIYVMFRGWPMMERFCENSERLFQSIRKIRMFNGVLL